MNQQIKTKWVAALRSGEYKQGKGLLYNEFTDCFCCLGVLCEISQMETGFGWLANVTETCGDHLLGKTIMEWSGLTVVPGDTVIIRESNSPLSGHNDAGRTFLEIATAIEEQL